MNTKENEQPTGSAEAENRETMDLLTGMLDAATRCGRKSQDNATDGTAQAAGETHAAHRNSDAQK